MKQQKGGNETIRIKLLEAFFNSSQFGLFVYYTSSTSVRTLQLVDTRPCAVLSLSALLFSRSTWASIAFCAGVTIVRHHTVLPQLITKLDVKHE